MVYYNENDPKAAAWLRELITQGHLPDGEVDERSIEDVKPDEIKEHEQCHFFAGIGGWPLALKWAGWRGPVWTGSCPCQPLSSAGKRKGHADKRHLWPAFHSLISECKPPTVFGEQVASKDGREWFAGIRLDLEELGYACGGADLCAAGVGAPHIRQRLWWVADAKCAGERGRRLFGPVKGVDPANIGTSDQPVGSGSNSGLADTSAQRRGEAGPDSGRPEEWPAYDRAYVGRMGNTKHDGPFAEPQFTAEKITGGVQQFKGPSSGMGDTNKSGSQGRGLLRERGGQRSAWAPSLDNWLPCADGKARRIEPGIEPLAHGVSGRVGLLRGYGNAIVPQVAAEFIGAYMEA